MKRTILAGLLTGAATSMAAAQTATPVPKEAVTDLTTGQVTIVYDEQLTDEFQIQREIVERVKAEFGEHAVYDTGQQLPEDLDVAIAPGNVLPEEAPVAEIPPQLGDLPTLGEGTRWVAAGEHLVEVTPDNRIVMVVYDALP